MRDPVDDPLPVDDEASAPPGDEGPSDPESESDAEPDADAPGPRARKRRSSALLTVGAVGVYAAIGVTAGLTLPIAFLVVLALSQLFDLAVIKDGYVRALLGRGQFGIATRSLVRELATFGLVLGAPWSSLGTRHAAALCVLGLAVLRLIYPLTLVPVRRRRGAVPVETRNMDVTGLRLPPVPPRLLVTRIQGRSHGLTLIGLVGAALGVVLGSEPLLFAVVGSVLLAELVALLLVVRLLLIGRRASRPGEVLTTVQARVSELRPEVMLYHTGNAQVVYQVNMWLSTMDALPRSSIIVLRERASMRLLGETSTPVMYIPQSVDFMSFGLHDVRVTLYTANAGRNIHMLREQGVRHVFIGHGDSDKSASSNPFSKVYTEIWVAGPAGRDRYKRANTGVLDEDIVEVGRPQLVGIDPATGRVGDGLLTILYAPTWEGWTKDPAQVHTSVVQTGTALVEQLVARSDVRLVYKPHPLTGSVSKASAAADKRIRAAIAAAGGAHQVITGPAPTLYESFNMADVLIGDVSSVLSDFLASYKPYIVVNLTPLSDDEFRDAFPSTSAAYLLDPAAERIGAIIDQIRASDPLAEQRRELKRYLLGPDDPDALSRFTAAVEAAYEKAVAQCPVRPKARVAAK